MTDRQASTPAEGGSLFADPRDVEILAANVAWCRAQALEDIAAGEAPKDVIERYFGFITGFVSGRVAMIIPPALVPPEELARGIERGKELAAKYGW